MNPLLSKYPVRVEYLGAANEHGLEKGAVFEGEMNIDFDIGYVHLVIIRPQPEYSLRLKYRNFHDLESDWKIQGIYRKAGE